MKDFDELSTEFQEHMVLIQNAYRADTSELAKKVLLVIDGYSTMNAKNNFKCGERGSFSF